MSAPAGVTMPVTHVIDSPSTKGVTHIFASSPLGSNLQRAVHPVPYALDTKEHDAPTGLSIVLECNSLCPDSSKYDVN
jgi:hypothetical protein